MKGYTILWLTGGVGWVGPRFPNRIDINRSQNSRSLSFTHFSWPFFYMIIFLRIIILSFQSHQIRILSAGLGMAWNRDGLSWICFANLAKGYLVIEHTVSFQEAKAELSKQVSEDDPSLSVSGTWQQEQQSINQSVIQSID